MLKLWTVNQMYDYIFLTSTIAYLSTFYSCNNYFKNVYYLNLCDSIPGINKCQTYIYCILSNFNYYCQIIKLLQNKINRATDK